MFVEIQQKKMMMMVYSLKCIYFFNLCICTFNRGVGVVRGCYIFVQSKLIELLRFLLEWNGILTKKVNVYLIDIHPPVVVASHVTKVFFFFF